MLRAGDNTASAVDPEGEAHGIDPRLEAVGLLQGAHPGTGLPQGAGRPVPEPVIQN